jgi:uncharacterized protein YcbX
VDGRQGTHPVRSDAEDRFDILPFLVTRPNLVIGGLEGLSERQWEGRPLRIGSVVIGMDDLGGRCIMTTFDPDHRKAEPGAEQLRRDSGRISVGDPAELIARP